MPFQKGNNLAEGGPGRPIKTRRAYDGVRRMFMYIFEDNPELLPRIVNEHIEIAHGNRDPKQQLAAIKEMFDRVYGPVPSKMELSGPNGRPIETEQVKMSLEEANEVLRKYRLMDPDFDIEGEILNKGESMSDVRARHYRTQTPALPAPRRGPDTIHDIPKKRSQPRERLTRRSEPREEPRENIRQGEPLPHHRPRRGPVKCFF